MKIEQLNKSRVPVIVLEKKLEQFRGKVLFPEKLKKANELLAKPYYLKFNPVNKNSSKSTTH